MDSIRIQNLRCFRDTGWIDLKPLTLITGGNGSGKSTLLQTFPLFKQTLENRLSEPILWYGEYVDFGDFQTSLSDFADEKQIIFEFAFSAPVRFLTDGESYTGNQKMDRENEISLPVKAGLFIKEQSVEAVFLSMADMKICLDFSADGFVNISINDDPCEEVKWKKEESDTILPNVRSLLYLMRPESNHFSFGYETGPADFLESNPLGELIRGVIMQITGEDDRSLTFLVYSCLTVHGLNFSEKYSDIEKYSPLIHRAAVGFSPEKRKEKKDPKGLTGGEIRLLIDELKKKEPLIRKYLLMIFLPSIIDDCNEFLSRYFQNVKYLSPQRALNQRYFRKQGLSTMEVDPHGQNVPEILQRMDPAEKKRFDEWLQAAFGFRLKVKSFEGHLSIFVQSGERDINAADAGSGISQVIPILLTLWKCQGADLTEETLIVIEQPEAYLHPDMQVQLLKQIVKMAASDNGIKFLLETHSETLVNSLGKLIAEREIESSKVKLLLACQSDLGESRIRAVKFTEEGYLSEWPMDFFRGGF